jgi:hypothetical protein
MDPQRARDEARIRGMLATAGGGNFAAYGVGSLNAQEQQRVAQKQAEEEYAKAAEGLVGIERGITDKALEGRGKARELTSGRETTGVQQARAYRGDTLTAENARLDRQSREEISKLEIAARREANQLQAQANINYKSESEYRRVLDARNRYEAAAEKRFDNLLADVMDGVLGGKPTPEQQERIKAIRDARAKTLEKIREDYEPLLSKFSPEGGTGGFRVTGSRPSK